MEAPFCLEMPKGIERSGNTCVPQNKIAGPRWARVSNSGSQSLINQCGVVLAPVLDEGELEPCGVVEGCVLPGAVVPGVVVFGVPFGEVWPGVVVPLGEVDPGVVVFGVPFGAVDPGVVAPGVAPGDVEPGVVVFGAVPGVVEFGVAPGVVDPGAVVFGVPFGDVDPGVVCVVPAGEVAFPGVELCPAVPELPEGAALPPDDGELCATTQRVQHRITDSNVSFFMDVICTSYACHVSESRPRACCLCVESRFKYFRLGWGGEYPADSVIWRGISSVGCALVKRSLALAAGCDGSYLYGVSAK